MGRLDIGQAQTSDYTNQVSTFSVDLKNTEGVSASDETIYQSPNWSKYNGYIQVVADLKAALISKSTWNTGKGYTCDSPTQVKLDFITGAGKDTFDDILWNMDFVSNLNGDSFAHIIRDEETGKLLNLKPLDPSTMRIIYNGDGIIKRYEQTAKTNPKGKPVRKYKLDEIFHLVTNRIADSIGGTSDLQAMEEIIDANMENFRDLRKLMHHQVKPFIMWKLKTDDQGKIQAFISKVNTIRNLGEDLYVPDDENIVSYEVVQLQLSPVILAWRDELRNGFYRTIGLPQVVAGAGGQSTESESKVIYLAAEQPIERRQRFLEKQLWSQVQIKINLIPPATLAENLQQDNAKDPNTFQPSDTQAGAGR